MKKNLFLVSALVMGMMSSCSSDVENVTVPGADQDLQPVELSIASPSVIVSSGTRGIGTVGDISGEAGNVWNGEDLYVNMMCVSLNGTPVWDYSYWDRVTNLDDNTFEKVINFQNVLAQAPKTAEATATGELTFQATTYGRYYPTTNSRHAFFAYHIDDAAATEAYAPNTGADPIITKDDTKKTLSTYFVIDGSQDLMVGKATPNQTDEKGLSFSAQSARAGIKPVLRMKHLLTRFTFEVQSDANLVVNKIIVKSKTKGKMIVAYADEMDVNSLLSFEDETASLELKQRDAIGSDLVALKDFTTTDQYQKIGEALMVAPGEKTYEVQVIATQNVGQNQTAPIPYTSTITIPNDVAAAAGTSYNVKINLYGLQKIDVDAELTGWAKGSDIELTPGE